MRAVTRCIVRFGHEHKAGLYYAACAVLLVAAAVLRFHDLSEKPLRHDEAVVANISGGAFSEVVSGTRCCSSSPILYPLILYAVQQVESTHVSLRIVPATASVLTVAAMLLLLPRLGVARGAAFLAAVLATLSVEAIRHAQDAREYSIDALVATLMVAGLLRYLRDGKKTVLCAFLFVAPLVQYGLALFGVAVIGAAAVMPRVSRLEGRAPTSSRIADWLRQRLDLAAPCGFLLAASAASYLATLRYHGTGFASEAHLSEYYYRGEFDAPSIFAFSIDGACQLLKYHLPQVVAIATLPAFAMLLACLGKVQGLQDRAIAVLFSFSIAISVSAAVLGLYPLGGIRQVLYLGPLVFLAVGVSLRWMTGGLSLLGRREYATPALLVMIFGAAFAGMSALRQDSPYKTPENIESVLAVLKEHVREEDMVYAGWGAVPAIRFYQSQEGRERPANYYYSKFWCTSFAEQCLREMANLAWWLGPASRRIWFVTYQRPAVLEGYLPNLSVASVGPSGNVNLILIEDAQSLIKIATTTELLRKYILARKPLIRSTFNVYLHGAKVAYVKEPCGAQDVQQTFFLHVIPRHASELPEHSERYGFDNLGFRFDVSGVRLTERCVALRELPDYDFAGIRTGQFVVNKDGSLTHRWEAEVRFDE